MKNIVIIQILLLLFLGCKKNDDDAMGNCEVGLEAISVPADNTDMAVGCPCPIDCQELLPGTPYDYFYPSFNPNSADEIVYLRLNNTTFSINHELWKFNFCTGEQTQLHDFVLGYTDWSVKDWILFTAPNHMIYKIKSSGDSLTQLTFSGDYNRRPTWSPDGTKFIFNTQTGSESIHILADEFGNPLDTTEFISGAWSIDNKIAFGTGLGGILKIGYYDVFTNEKVVIYEAEVDPGNNNYWVRSTGWINDGEGILWVAEKNIGITNIWTGETTILKEGASNRHYSFSAVSPDGQKVVINRIDREEIENCQVDNKYRLYIMDIDGENERWIQIPE